MFILGKFSEVAKYGEFIVNATSGAGTLQALALAGKENLAGKVLLDIANPLDFSKGMPPTLLISITDSLREQVQRNFQFQDRYRLTTGSVRPERRQFAVFKHLYFLHKSIVPYILLNSCSVVIFRFK